MRSSNRARGRHGRRQTRAGFFLVLVGVLVCSSGGIALAWNIATANAGNSVTAAKLGMAGTPSLVRSPASGGSCSSITVSWESADAADRYRVQRRIDSDAWTMLATSHATTSLTDTPATAFTEQAVEYRITPLYSGSNSWEGPATTARIACGIAGVDDLSLTAACSTNRLDWSTSEGATQYDVLRSVNMAGFTTISAGVIGTSYTDATQHPTGANVRYVVRASDGTRTSSVDSNIATNPSFSPFRILTVAFSDAGTPNQVDLGDRVLVTFSEPVSPGSLAGAGSNSVFLQRNGKPKGVFLAAAVNSIASTGIAHLNIAKVPAGANGAVTGATSWGDSNTTWTWTRDAAAPVNFGTPDWSETATAGTSAANPSRIRCSDGVATLADSSVTPTGWF